MDSLKEYLGRLSREDARELAMSVEFPFVDELDDYYIDPTEENRIKAREALWRYVGTPNWSVVFTSLIKEDIYSGYYTQIQYDLVMRR